MPSYYETEDLSKLKDLSLGAPALWEKFQSWYSAVFQDGALTGREKALIALAVSNALQCPYCIDVYTRSSVEQGADLAQMTEVLQVAAAIKAGSALSHGVQVEASAARLSMA